MIETISWITDPHLNHLEKPNEVIEAWAEEPTDALVITGDIADAGSIEWYLKRIDETVQKPVYLVLGNHDFYGGSLEGVDKTVEAVVEKSENLFCPKYSDAPLVLNDHWCLAGHHGWYDAGYGDGLNSRAELWDWDMIDELRECSDKEQRLGLLRSLGSISANHVFEQLKDVQTKNVLIMTHVPPYKELCKYRGVQTDDSWLPWYANRSMGLALDRIRHANKLVLSGHTHSYAKVEKVGQTCLAGTANFGRALTPARLLLAGTHWELLI